MRLPPPPPPPPPSAPTSPFDAERYSATLGEVHAVALRVRSLWERTTVAFLRADGLLLLGLGLGNLASSSSPQSLASPFLGPGWLFSVAVVAFGAVVIAFPRLLLRRSVRRFTRRGRIPALEMEPQGPSLDAATRAIGQMRKEWSFLPAQLAVSVLLVVVTLLSVGTGLVKAAPKLLGSAGSWPAQLWPLAIAATFLGCSFALWVWVSQSVRQIRRLDPEVRAVDERFRQLEWAFWQRY